MWKDEGKKPIRKYLIITLGISWSAMFLMLGVEKLQLLSADVLKIVVMLVVALFGAGAPGISVYILLKSEGIIKGFKEYFNRVFEYKSRKDFWITLALVFAFSWIMHAYLGERVKEISVLLAPFLLVFMIPGGGWEELGWRGFLQPVLEEKAGFIPGTILMGIIWAVWHLPLWLLKSADQSRFLFSAFCMYCIMLSFLLGITYAMTKSVWAVILVHAWQNVMTTLYRPKMLMDSPSEIFYIIFGVVVIGSIIAHYVLISRKKNL